MNTRLKGFSGRRRRLLAVAAAALTLALVAVACQDASAPDTPQPSEEPASQPEPGESGEPGEDSEPEEPEGDEPAHEVVLFFVRSGDDRLWVEPERHWVTSSTDRTPLSVFTALFNTAPHDPVLTSAVPSGVTVLNVTVDGSTAIVDVDAALTATSTGSAGELAFAEQLAHTATTLPGVTAVRLLIDGEPISELWGHLDWSVAIEPDPFSLSPITIASPAHGATVPAGEITAEGEATVFEANFMVRLRMADGTLLEEGPVMASTGAPERGTWSVTYTITEPGTYLIEAEEDDPSGGEGRPPLIVQREFVVTSP